MERLATLGALAFAGLPLASERVPQALASERVPQALASERVPHAGKIVAQGRFQLLEIELQALVSFFHAGERFLRIAPALAVRCPFRGHFGLLIKWLILIAL